MLGYVYIDTGAMYRSIALKALRRGISLEDGEALTALTGHTRIDLRAEDGGQKVLLDSEDVTSAIRTPEVARAASKVAVVARRAPRAGGRTAPGRRARRRGDGGARHRHRGFPGRGAEDFSYRVAGGPRRAPLARAPAEGRRDRPRRARSRKSASATAATASAKICPLVRAKDATVVDSTAMEPEEVARLVVMLARENDPQPLRPNNAVFDFLHAVRVGRKHEDPCFASPC